MRLFQVIAGGQAGGFESFFVRLTTALQARDDIAQKVAIRSWAARNEELRQSGVEMVVSRMRGRFDLVGRWRLNAAIRHYKPDLIMSWANRATSITAAGTAPLVARLGHYYNLKNYRHCDGLITITRGIADYAISGGFPAQRIMVVPNFFAPAGQAPLARELLAVPEDVPLILAVGRLHPAKGFDVLIKALKALPRAHLLIAGEGPSHRALAELADELGIAGRVRFLGWRDDVEALMRTADVFAMPSRSEGLGSVIVEAWASGIPIVAAASEGPGELIEDRANGLLVPIDDVEALSRSLDEVIEDRDWSSRLAAAGSAEFKAKYTAARITDAYVNAFEQFVRLGARTDGRLPLKATDTTALDIRASMKP